LMAVGALFDDMVGRFARTCACVGLLMLGVAAWVRYPLIVGTLPARVVPLYATSIVATTAAYGVFMRDRFYLAAAAAIVAAWLAHSGVQSYQQLRRLVAGLDQLVYGVLFFLLAAAISFRKAGIWPKPGFPSRLFRARR
jgi:hypothetical protein